MRVAKKMALEHSSSLIFNKLGERWRGDYDQECQTLGRKRTAGSVGRADEGIREHPVRLKPCTDVAPSRYQALIRVVEGKAIRLHPWSVRIQR